MTMVTRFELYPNLVSVITNMVEMLKDDFDLRLVIGSDNDIPEFIIQNCEVITLEKPKIEFKTLVYSYKAVIRAMRCDGLNIVANITQPYPIGVLLSLACWFNKRTKAVIRISGDFFDERNHTKSLVTKIYKIYVYEKMLLLAFRKAHFVLPIGENLKSKFVSCGFPESKLRVAPQPFLSEPFNLPEGLDRKKVKQHLGLLPNKITVLFVARLEPNKGISDLIQIIQGVLQQSDDFQFCIIGKGSAMSEFSGFKEDHLVLTGFVPRERLHNYYHASNLLVYPTKKDASPTVLLEALSAELPIVSTAVGEIPYLVKNIRSSNDQFIEFILNKKYVKDKKPMWFNWQSQKRLYRDIYLEVYDSFVGLS